MRFFPLPIRLKFLSAIAATALLSGSCCKSNCDAIAMADLLIPEVLKIFNFYGQPVVDPFSGQQMEDTNMMVYNQRTGEYFSPRYGSRAGVQLGDFLQIGVRLFNQYAESTCNRVSAAPESKTGYQLGFTANSQPTSYFTMPDAYTPPLGGNGSGVSITGLQITRPGYYSVKATADKTGLVSEYDENNNLFQNPNTGTTLGRQIVPAGLVLAIKVEAPAGWSAETSAFRDRPAIIPTYVGTTAESWRNSPLVQFMESPAYAAYQASQAAASAAQPK